MNHNLLKQFLIAVLAGAAAGLFTGCNRRAAASTQSAPPPPAVTRCAG